MDPYIPGLITAVCVGLTIGLLAGWYAAHEKIRKQNRAIADKMMASVGARRTNRSPSDMMDYTNRQRTTAPNNGEKARQGNVVFRPRRIARRR